MQIKVTPSTVDDVHVLYVDHTGHAAPLSMCFHATASRQLSSWTTNKHPSSTITEVDSAFCPQCLSFYDAATASSLGYCPKPSCKLCPICQAVASVCIVNQEAFYKCGYCTWNSKTDSDLVVPVSETYQIEKAKEDIGKALEARLSPYKESLEKHNKQRLKALEEKAKFEVMHSKAIDLKITLKSRKKGVGPWSIAQLEESLQDKQKEMKALTSPQIDVPSASLQKLDESVDGFTLSSFALQSGTPSSKKDFLPLPIPLRPRKSRRCNAELAEGRPGILVKPKLNPLEGDTSLRSGHGQFWKKDSSAIHVIPKIVVCKLINSSLLLRVQNPTLGQVELRLGSSMYKGEPSWDKDGPPTKVIRNVTLNALSGESIGLAMLELETSLTETEWALLDPLEDAFLDMASASRKDPEAVQHWTGDGISEDLTFVAKQGDQAWFQIGLPSSVHENYGVPVSLQIKAGEGSWESSLIKAPKGGETVCFDVVLLVRQTSANEEEEEEEAVVAGAEAQEE